MRVLFLLALASTLLLTAASAQTSDVSVHATVTLEGKTAAPLSLDQVTVQQNNHPLRVTGLVPATGQHAGLQFFIVIDDGADRSLGSSIPSLQSFVKAMPASASVGLAYMRQGTVQIVHTLSTDHAAVASAIRPPLGEPGISSAPYDSLADLVKHWPTPPAERREILLLSSGIDPMGDFSPQDQFFLSALADAQSAGIVIYDIFVPDAGHYGHTYWRITLGQDLLSQLADETGGESYFLTVGGRLISGDLDDIAGYLQHQYILSFLIPAGPKPALEHITIHSTAPGADLAAPDAVYVPPNRG